jgi:hypothetical protein
MDLPHFNIGAIIRQGRLSTTQPLNTTPLRLRTLLLVLIAQLLCADVLRLPLTTSTITTDFEYLLGQEVIASENWRRDGALARHFIPSRSIDQTLPEWPFRDDYWRDYLSQPPLSWMLHYWASRAFDRVDPIVVGKLLGQVMTAAGVLLAAPFLLEAFGFGAALSGLSFVIWSFPFLVSFIDGYYSTTPAVLCQLVLASWGVAFFTRALSRSALEDGSGVRARDLIIAASLAYLGTLSEWVALFGNAVAVAAFVALGGALLAGRQTSRAWKAFAAAVAIAAGSAAAELTTVLMYASRTGYRFYFQAFMDRVNERTGDTGIVPYTGVLIQQLEKVWPRWMLIALTAMVVVTAMVAVARLWRHRRDAARSDGTLLLLALVLGFGSGATYCYRLTNLVTIHWWFAGTWVVGWMMTVCAFAYVVRTIIGRVADPRWASIGYPVFASCLWAGAAGWNLHFVNLTPPAAKPAYELYRSLGRALPRDGVPIAIADTSPALFLDDYPFATAYLRRPIVRFGPPGSLFKLGTSEDAKSALLAYGGFTYLAYDPWQHQCVGEDATPVTWRPLVPMAICRVPTESLVRDPAGLFRADDGRGAAAFARWVTATIDAGACCDRPSTLLAVTKLIDSGLRTRPGAAVELVRRQNVDALRRVVESWQRLTHSSNEQNGPSVASPSLLGILAGPDAWYILLGNLAGHALPGVNARTHLLINGQARDVTTWYQSASADGAALLPLSLMTIPRIPGLPDRDLHLDLLDADASIASASGALVISIPDGDLGSGPLGQAQVLLEGRRCSAPPGPPVDLRIVSIEHAVVTLAWTGSTGDPTSYVLDAGRAPGASDPGQFTFGAVLTATVSGVKPGTYYARLRAFNACGRGPASNEIVAVVR